VPIHSLTSHHAHSPARTHAHRYDSVAWHRLWSEAQVNRTPAPGHSEGITQNAQHTCLSALTFPSASQLCGLAVRHSTMFVSSPAPHPARHMRAACTMLTQRSSLCPCAAIRNCRLRTAETTTRGFSKSTQQQRGEQCPTTTTPQRTALSPPSSSMRHPHKRPPMHTVHIASQRVAAIGVCVCVCVCVCACVCVCGCVSVSGSGSVCMCMCARAGTPLPTLITCHSHCPHKHTNDNRYWRLYVQHELKNKNFAQVQALLNRSLVQCVSVPLYQVTDCPSLASHAACTHAHHDVA
jgi:hypothetical protein